MTQDELRALLLLAGWPCRIKGAEVVLQTCPDCGNDRANAELNLEKGAYHAWCCGAHGRLDRVVERLTGHALHLPAQAPGERKPRTPRGPLAPTEIPREFLPVDGVALAARYLERRGVDSATAARYGLRVCMTDGHRLAGRIVVPMRDYWTGALLGWVGRSLWGTWPKYLSTLGRRVLAGWTQRSAPATVVVEGPFDGIAVHRAGYATAVLGGTGAGPEVVAWASRLPPTVPIIVLLDADAAAQAQRLYWQIQPVHPAVTWVALPVGTDPGALAPEALAPFLASRVPGIAG